MYRMWTHGGADGSSRALTILTRRGRFMPLSIRHRLLVSTTCGLALMAALSGSAHAYDFTAGDLVVSVYGRGASGDQTTYTDNQATPITLQEVTPTGLSVGQLVLPQAASGANHAISGEYGSSSEGTLQRSADGQYLTIAGYGVSAAAFNPNAQSFGGATKSCIGSATPCYPLAQTASVAGTPGSAGSGVATATVVPRVVALVGANGSVDTSTALTGVFNGNNPRSVATVDGSTFYISGQGQSGDTTQGLFVAQKGASTATAINTTVDTRTVSIFNNQLFLSTDTTQGSGVTENISSVGAAGSLPTGATTPTILTGLKSKYTVSSLSQLNSLEQASLPTNPAYTTASKTKGIVYLSPENFFFADPNTLYVADSGNPKGDNNGAGSTPQGLGDGGLQKWKLIGGTWVLQYTLTTGLLDFVEDNTGATSGTTGLIGLAGQVVGGVVELFATNSTLGDLDQTYLYGINDPLAATAPAPGESFAVLTTAAADTNIRGVAFAPVASAVAVPEPAGMGVLGVGLVGLYWTRRGRAAWRGNSSGKRSS